MNLIGKLVAQSKDNLKFLIEILPHKRTIFYVAEDHYGRSRRQSYFIKFPYMYFEFSYFIDQQGFGFDDMDLFNLILTNKPIKENIAINASIIHDFCLGDLIYKTPYYTREEFCQYIETVFFTTTFVNEEIPKRLGFENHLSWERSKIKTMKISNTVDKYISKVKFITKDWEFIST